MREGVIYKIQSSNYFIYGSTVHPERRKQSHLTDLKKGKHCNSFLQKVYNKYNDFDFTVVQENIPEEILRQVEDIWIGANCAKVLDNKNGLNIIDGTRLDFNIIVREKKSLSMKKYMSSLSVEERSNKAKKAVKTRAERFDLSKLISESRQKYKYENWDNNQSYPVLQLELDGTPLKLWASSYQAEKEKDFSSSHIRRCCLGLSKTYKKYKWEYADKETVEKMYHLKNIEVPVCEKSQKNIPIYQYDLGGNFIKSWLNQREIAKSFNVGYARVCEWIIKNKLVKEQYMFSKLPPVNN